MTRNGQQLVIADDLGQVGDLLTQDPDANIQIVRTIPEAIHVVESSTPGAS